MLDKRRLVSILVFNQFLLVGSVLLGNVGVVDRSDFRDKVDTKAEARAGGKLATLLVVVVAPISQHFFINTVQIFVHGRVGVCVCSWLTCGQDDASPKNN